jgi:hypothetical protein
LERRVPAQHDVHDHAAAPYITLEVIILGQYLWGGVVRRPELLRQLHSRVNQSRCSKINDLHHRVITFLI